MGPNLQYLNNLLLLLITFISEPIHKKNNNFIKHFDNYNGNMGNSQT